MTSEVERCPSCLMTGFETLTLPCAFCGISGCDLCIYDGDCMYNAPTCCPEAAATNEAWWCLPSDDRFKHPRGLTSKDTTREEALSILAQMQVASGLVEAPIPPRQPLTLVLLSEGS